MLHDIRRTVATGLQRLGIRFEVTEAILNHVSGAKGGVAGVYQRHDWKSEKRAALDAWSRHLQALIAGFEKGNVVRFMGEVGAVAAPDPPLAEGHMNGLKPDQKSVKGESPAPRNCSVTKVMTATGYRLR